MSSTASRSPRTSSSATSWTEPASPGGRGRPTHARAARPSRSREPLPQHRGRPAQRREQADREHGARAVARHQADHHGRAVGGARRRGGQEPLPRREGAHRRRASRSSTSPIGSKRSARSATASRCSKTVARWRAACPPPIRPPPSSSGLMTGRARGTCVPPSRPRRRRRSARPRGRRSESCGHLRRRLVLGARRRGRRPRRTGRVGSIRDPRDGLRGAAGHRRDCPRGRQEPSPGFGRRGGEGGNRAVA